MICHRCQKDLKCVRHRVPGVDGKVCRQCRQKWVVQNVPGAAEKYRQDVSRYNRVQRMKDPEARRLAKHESYLRNQEGVIAGAVAYRRKRSLIDPVYRMVHNVRRRFHLALTGTCGGSAVRDLGCSIPELKVHLESKFQPGMTWENYGLHGWHIDHVKPLASFDLADRQQLLEAVNYKNLQPLWAKDNLAKGARG